MVLNVGCRVVWCGSYRLGTIGVKLVTGLNRLRCQSFLVDCRLFLVVSFRSILMILFWSNLGYPVFLMPILVMSVVKLLVCVVSLRLKMKESRLNVVRLMRLLVKIVVALLLN